MTQRITGVLTDTKQAHTNTVMRIEKGDLLLLHGEYVQVDGFFKNHQGTLCMRLGIPKDRQRVRQWAHNNPHHIKQLTIGGILIGG